MRLTCSIATWGCVAFGMNWSKNESTTTRTDSEATCGALNGSAIARVMDSPFDWADEGRAARWAQFTRIALSVAGIKSRSRRALQALVSRYAAWMATNQTVVDPGSVCACRGGARAGFRRAVNGRSRFVARLAASRRFRQAGDRPAAARR